MDARQAAMYWLERGVATIPLLPCSKNPAGKALIRSGSYIVEDGKPKGTWIPFKEKLPTPKQIDLWFEDNQPYGLAVVTGWSGLIVLDFDDMIQYANWFCWQLDHNPKVTKTFQVTSGRGIHLYYFIDKPGEKIKIIRESGYEARYNGKLVTTLPSVHPSGKQYHALNNPSDILTVRLSDIMTYCPVVLYQPLAYPTFKQSRYAPTVVSNTQDSIVSEIKAKISLLSFFPVTQQLDNEKRFYRTHCPIHGHKDNFWLDTKLGICGCYAGCCPTMDVITLFSKMNNLDIKQSIQELRRML